LLARRWVVVSTLIAIAGLVVFVLVETQLAHAPAAKLSQVSDLAEALGKVHWIDIKLKEFEEAAAQYKVTSKRIFVTINLH
jgi:hypothetical protein